jgi:D-alanine-D-alanine ligase
VFVKPANLGSSVGITKVDGPAGVAAALALAASYDEWIAVEEAAHGRELEVGVLGNAEPHASVPGEIVPTHDFYDYDDKYLAGAAAMIIPADLPDDAATEIRRLAVATFTALRCEGMARVDFFYEPDGRGLLINEVNTIPGFTPGSMFPRMWEASGLTYAQLVDELIRLALERHEHRARLSTKR